MKDRICRMWCAGNKTALLGCFLAAVASVAPALAAPPASAAKPKVTPAQAAPAMAAPLPDWSHGRQVHQLVEQWIERGQVDEKAPLPVIRAQGVQALRVTLRSSGVTTGWGDAPASPIAGGTVDLAPMARVAAARALEALAKAIQENRQRVAASVPGAATAVKSAAASLAAIGPTLQIDVQIAYRFEPIPLAEKAGENELLSRFVAGFHGLRLTRPASGQAAAAAAWMWPANALAANISPHSQVTQLLTDLGYPAQDASRVGKPGGPSLERFEVVHVVRPTLNQPVTPLVRGHVILPATSLDNRTLDAMAARMTSHLLQRVRDDGSMTGMYHPSSGRYDPETASLQDTALVAYALARRATALANLQGDAQERQLAQDACRRSTDFLIQQLLAKGAEVDLPAMALAAMTIAEAPHLADRKAARDELTQKILALRGKDGLFRASPDAKQPLGLPLQSLAVTALASVYQQTRHAETGRAARQSQEMLWLDSKPPQRVSMLPWLIMAELQLRRLEDPSDAAAALRWEDRAKELRTLAQSLRSRQITAAPAPPAPGASSSPADVVGGFELTDSTPQAYPTPDWRSVPVLAFLAAGLRQPALVPDNDRLRWLLDAGLAARFMAQLMFSEAGCYYVRGPEHVLGAVRPTLWDNRLGLPPTALGLIAATELQEAAAGFQQHLP